MAAGPIAVTSSGAHGDPIADKQKQAQEIAAKLDSLQHQVENAANKYEAAQSRIAELDAEIQTQQTNVANAKAQQSQDQRELAKYAINSYVTGGGTDSLTDLVSTSTDKLGQRQGYTQAAMGNRQQLVDNLQASRKDAEDQIQRLDAARKEADAAKAKAAQEKASAQAATNQYEALNNQVQGELRQLVEAKRQAEARAAEARAFAAAQARAQAQAAQASAARRSTGVVAVANIPAAPTSSGGNYNVPVSSGSGGGAAVAAAQSQLGVPYGWGAEQPGVAFDCSGLTQWAWARAGVSIPRTTYAQINAGRRVSISQIQPGDLVFYYGTGHVAMYVGGGTVIHAPHTGDVVRYASLYMSTPEAVVRP
jgi:cell wall-associated NlpC family hydrolase